MWPTRYATAWTTTGLTKHIVGTCVRSDLRSLKGVPDGVPLRELTTYATPLTAAYLGLNRLSGSLSNRRGGAVVSLLMWEMEGRAVERFFDDEASRLAAAIAAIGFPAYPVLQRDRALVSSNTALPQVSRAPTGGGSCLPASGSETQARIASIHTDREASSLP